MVDDTKATATAATAIDTANAKTFAQIKARKTAKTQSCMIQLDGSIAEKIATLRDEIMEQIRIERRSNEPEKAPEMSRVLEGLLDKARDTEQKFTFKALSRQRYDDLILAHPASPEQKKEGFQWNPETFPPMLIAASSFDPKITDEDAMEIWTSDDWSPAELVRLFETALSVNAEITDIPFDNRGIDRMLSTARRSTTAPIEVSPGVSS